MKLEQYKRPYNEEEKQILKSYKNSYWDHFENFAKKWMLITLVTIAPLLLYDKYVNKVTSNNQLIVLIVSQIFTISIVVYFMIKMGEIGWNSALNKEINEGKAIVWKVYTKKVFKREETFDLGSGFYIEISENQTLYLQGQYFDELQYNREFPNTSFEIVRTSLIQDGLFHYKAFGTYLEPEKVLDAFTSEQFEKEEAHYNLDILEISIEEIV